MKNEYIIAGLVVLVIVAFAGYSLMSNNENQPTENMDQDIQVNEDESMAEEMADKQNIVEIASGNPEFSTLVTAVIQAELVDTLSSEGPFTLFAPTNEAFNALPEGTLESVLADNELLTSILTYHVVSGKVMAEDVVQLDSATTVQGSDVSIEVLENGTVMVNDANVVNTDIEASNGVIHVIDTVLIPE